MGPETRTTGLLSRRRARGDAPPTTPWNEGTPSENSTAQRLLSKYKNLTYQTIGHRFEARPRPRLATRLQQARMTGGPEVYLGLMTITTLAVFIGVGALSIVGFALLGTAYWLPIAIGVTLLVTLSSLAAFPFVLTTRIQNRRATLDRELPYSLSELAVLASIGLSPIEMLRKMAQRDYDKAMTSEFRRVTHKTDIQGKDMITALAETARTSASDAVRQTFWDITNMIHQGGDLDEYLRNQSDTALDNKRASQRQFIDRLGTYADIYVTLVLIGVMFLGVGAFLMDAFGTTAGGLPASALLQILAYGIIPVLVFTLGLLLATAHQKEGA